MKILSEPEEEKGYKPDQERIEELFRKIDKNQDGIIDAEELAEGLKTLGGRYTKGQAEKILQLGDSSKDSVLSFEEFVDYAIDHERKLWMVFKSVDSDGSEAISASELRKAFEKMNVHVSQQEIDLLLKSVDKDGTLQVDWNEWREYHLLNPSGHSLHEIIKFWKHSSCIDIGENMAIPDEFTEEELKTGMWWRQLTCGATAGIFSRTMTAPLERLKILLQVHLSPTNQISIVSGFKTMLQEGGIKSLWRGNGANIVKIAPESALKFFSYQRFKKVLGYDGRTVGPSDRLVAGAMAGLTSTSLIYPMESQHGPAWLRLKLMSDLFWPTETAAKTKGRILEVLKTRLALRKTGQYRGIVDAAMAIIQKEGPRSLYRGLVPSLLAIVPYAGIDLAVYETLKTSYLSHHKNDSANPGILVLLGCGTISSTSGQLSSYPLALVRTKLQAQIKPGKGQNGGDGMRSLIQQLFREDGVRGLYRGLAPNLLKVVPAVSVSYVVCEHMRRNLGIN